MATFRVMIPAASSLSLGTTVKSVRFDWFSAARCLSFEKEHSQLATLIAGVKETRSQIKLNGLLLQPETRVEHLHNVHELFALMRQINVRLGTIQPENVMNGDKESILQLVQAISNHFKRHPRGRRSVSPHPYSTNSDRAAVYQNASTGSNAISKHAINGNCGPHKLHRNHSLIGGHCNGYAQSHGTVVASEEGATKSITALTVMLNGHRAKGTIHRSERSYD
ncbi:unnamed protein product [Dicrocoelium dendriticum]|nr:unnamed protein product [Dicrocoelium dendriticum]